MSIQRKISKNKNRALIGQELACSSKVE